MIKHYFFDLDDTLTPSKALILERHVPLFKDLCGRADVTIVSGHGTQDIRTHMREETIGLHNLMGQNGNRAETKDGRVLWDRLLSEQQKTVIFAFIDKVRARLGYEVRDENDLIDDRGSEIAYSLIGHHEDSEKKKAFDPNHAIRLGVLERFASDVQTLAQNNVEVRTGGTTVLDFFELGKNKGFNIQEFLRMMSWKAEDCLYIGDALFPGGNDETVIGIIPTKAVRGPDDTFSFIREVLS